ncbi:MAG: ATP synthase F1 subunit epsilon [Candidatus Falkowbacteria bacterium]|nr:ATP synthase F1 subunit epsilon [Candidatus Falkowbacteria bacterium]
MSDTSRQFRFEIASPERVVLKAEVTQVSIPTVDGEITILPLHIPLVALLKPGIIEATLTDGTLDIMSVSGGLVEVLANKVVVLADSAERAEELNEAAIEKARARAEELKEQARHQDDVEFARLSSVIEHELAKTHAVKRWKKIKQLDK